MNPLRFNSVAFDSKMIQLAFEYDPEPPFDAGSPERAGEALVAEYHRREANLAPDRLERLRAAAARRGFS